ncbi:MAG TPA: hypothetical protein VF070_47425 [Streptosporangiaceae bacterium]
MQPIKLGLRHAGKLVAVIIEVAHTRQATSATQLSSAQPDAPVAVQYPRAARPPGRACR